MWGFCDLQKMENNRLSGFWSTFIAAIINSHSIAKQEVLAFLCQAWSWVCFNAGILGAWVQPMRSTVEVSSKVTAPLAIATATAMVLGPGSCSSQDPQISGPFPAWEKSLSLSLSLNSFFLPLLSLPLAYISAINSSLHTYKEAKNFFFSTPVGSLDGSEN